MVPDAAVVPKPTAARLPAAAALDRPVVLSRLVGRYVLTALVTLVVVAVLTAYVSRRLGTRAAIEDANRTATVIARTAVEPALTDGLLTGQPAALAAVDQAVRRRVLSGSLTRVKIWSPDGTIRYSDEARLIGDRFELEPAELQALRAGVADGELSDLSEPENRFEQRAAKLLEIYLPVRTPSGAALLFEAYFTYDGIAEAGRRLWLGFAPVSLGALLLLELLQVPLALSLARRLRRTQQRREEALRGALAATDAERRRIASDLHDGVVQHLAGVAFSLGAVARQPGGRPADAHAAREAAASVADAIRALRSLLVDIYPPNLADEGLAAALSDLLAGLRARGIEGSLVVTAPVDELDPDVTRLLYRAAQEGMRNVLAHAGADRVAIRVSAPARDRVLLEVADDGRGLDADSLRRSGHLGLRALGGLAADMGASLRVESTPGRGTVLALEVPTA